MPELVAEIAALAGADRREPAQLDREDQQAVDRDDEGRHGDEPTESMPVMRSSAEPRRTAAIAAERDADQDRPAMLPAISARVKGSCSRRSSAPTRLRQHVGAEIAAQHAAEELQQLDIDRQIEAHLGAERARISGVASGPSATVTGSPGMT